MSTKKSVHELECPRIQFPHWDDDKLWGLGHEVGIVWQEKP